MSELIPSYPLSEFKKLKTEEIRRLKSCELTSDGIYVCTIVVPQTDYIRVQTEYNCQTGNAVGGETLENILAKEAVNAS